MIKQFRHFQTPTRPSAQNIYEVVYRQKRTEIRSFHASLLLLYKYAGGAHPNWPLPSLPPREEAEISSVRKSPKATPTSQADAVTHTPVAKSQSRSIYYPPPSLSLPRIPMCFSSWPRRGSQTLLSKLLALPAASPSFTSAALGPGLQVLACLGKFLGKMSSTTRNQSGQKYLCLVQVTYLHYSPQY